MVGLKASDNEKSGQNNNFKLQNVFRKKVDAKANRHVKSEIAMLSSFICSA